MDSDIRAIVSTLELPDQAIDLMANLVDQWRSPDTRPTPLPPGPRVQVGRPSDPTPSWGRGVDRALSRLMARYDLPDPSFRDAVQRLVAQLKDSDAGPPSLFMSLPPESPTLQHEVSLTLWALTEELGLAEEFSQAVLAAIHQQRARPPRHVRAPCSTLGPGADGLISQLAREEDLAEGPLHDAIQRLVQRRVKRHSLPPSSGFNLIPSASSLDKPAPWPTPPPYSPPYQPPGQPSIAPWDAPDAQDPPPWLPPPEPPLYQTQPGSSEVPPDDETTLDDDGPTDEQPSPAWPASSSSPPALPPSLAGKRVAMPSTGLAQDVAERFADVGLLGKGGMGEVRRVLDRSLNRTVALKAIRRDLAWNDRVVSRFVAEAQATGQLQHPGIVPVYELGQLPDGRIYFTMREVKGRDLGRIIVQLHDAFARTGRLGPTPDGWTLHRVVDALLKVCEAVAYAHSRGVIHRDLKPDNVMVGAYGEVLVVDWGLSRILGKTDDESDEDAVMLRDNASLTMDGRVAGTPSYMPPEQAMADREAQGPRSDVYALGAILFEILTGEPPYTGETPEHILKLVMMGRRRPWPDSPATPEALRQIADKALSRKREHRYPSARELADALAGWLDGAQRRAQALKLLGEAHKKSTACDRLRARADAMRKAAHDYPGDSMDPEEMMAMRWSRLSQAEKLDEGAQTLDVVVTQLAGAALAQDPGLTEAHAMLAEHYRRNHTAAEARSQGALAERYRLLLQSHDVGEHAAYLKGDGALTLITDPPGARVLVQRYTPHDRRLRAEPTGQVLTTPIIDHELPMGSYLLLIRAEGRIPVHYPVHIGRQEHWHGVAPNGTAPTPIWLPPKGELASDETYVPAGWFRCGDEAAPNASDPERVWLDAFAIRRDPVSNREYLGFLDALVKDRRDDEAARFVPRAPGLFGVAGVQAYPCDRHGQYTLPRAGGWLVDTPVVLVDFTAANAYAAWLGVREGRAYRLPHELEWEKAARGVDGRAFSWGSSFDPTLCAMQQSAQRAHAVKTSRFQLDASPYGTRGVAGNVRDWCRNLFGIGGLGVVGSRLVHRELRSRGRSYRAVRGGAWDSGPDDCQLACRQAELEDSRLPNLGFRLARVLKR